MRVDVLGTSLQLSPSLEVHTRIRVVAAVGAAERRVERITIRFIDANGPRGGQDKVCRIETRLTDGNPWVIETADRDPYTAADRAIALLKRSLNKRLDRKFFRRGKNFVRRFVDRLSQPAAV